MVLTVMGNRYKRTMTQLSIQSVKSKQFRVLNSIVRKNLCDEIQMKYNVNFMIASMMYILL